MLSVVLGVHPAQATTMTAGVVLEKMKSEELFAYINGIVEGMAYARFRKDTLAAGHKVETGMKCIYDWYYSGDGRTHLGIEDSFRANADHMPSVIIATLIKRECGE